MGNALAFDYVGSGIEEDKTLLGVLDRLLDAGVVISGDLRISVANVDLLEIGLRVLIASTDTAERWHGSQPISSEPQRSSGFAS